MVNRKLTSLLVDGWIALTNQVDDAEELSKLQELHDSVYEQAHSWFQNLKNRFRNQILQHFGAMPEREPDIQVGLLNPL